MNKDLSTSGTIQAPVIFTATPGNMHVDLLWEKENDADNVLIRCDTSQFPASVTDGKLVYEGKETEMVHTDVEYGKTYYYTIWSGRFINGEWVYSSDTKSSSVTPYNESGPDEH